MNERIVDRLAEALAGRYALEGEIDRGAMAIVHLARDLKHGRKVAVKVLNPALAPTLGTERFLREVEVIARLQHPNILTLIDSGEVDGVPYYVMPFVEGQSLKHRLERDGPLPVDDAVAMACEIADALGAAHDRGVIHRDMKPGNVLLSGGHAMVADFGIAAALDEAQVGRLTDTGVSLGSPAYMSPEQATGDREIDGRADIYGLGCLLYEMLAGRPPFEGSVRELLTRKVLGKHTPLRELRPDVPEEVREVVERAMQIDPDNRFESARHFRDALLAALPRREAAGRTRRWNVGAVAATLLVVLVAAVVVQRIHAAGERALWVSQQLTEIERLADAGRYTEALAIAEEVEAVVPDEPALAQLLPRFTFTVPIRTAPPGATVRIQRMDEPEEAWRTLGTTPLEGVRFAGISFQIGQHSLSEPHRPHRLRFTLPGHQERELLLSAVVGATYRGLPPLDPVELLPSDPELEDMVPIPGFTAGGVEYAAFHMDRFEVTNADFQAFVDAGGYSDPRYWEHDFVEGDRTLSFAEAMDRFRDQTGRPGPATWRLGSVPEGRGDHPVGGVSWYEAAAYARWRGKDLPTTAHWDRGRLFYREDGHVIVPASNLGSDGPRPVGRNRAMTSLGVYDLVGNVREWCYNEAGAGQRATRGGAWPDAPFHVAWIIPKDAWDRHETHGFRLVRVTDDGAKLAALQGPVAGTAVRDYTAETPASDAEFAIFRRLYDYASVPLNARVERVDSTEHWIREHVTFDLPYGGRGGVALYLPRRSRDAGQTVIYWGGSSIMAMRSIDEEWMPGIDFIIRSGRTVAVPIFSGAYGRDDPRPAETRGFSTPAGDTDAGYRDILVQWVKDVRATIDYLETREDVGTEGLGFYGLSLGAARGPIALAVEPRIHAAVLNVGGLSLTGRLPEVDEINFVPRVTIPVLMINGEHDIVFPYEVSQRPMFELLGTDPEHKRHYLSPASHIVPQDEVIRETLDWFDRYLGVPGAEPAR
ncbi:MAG: protein kinase [Gemmatimonadota bacterium]